MHYHLVTTVIFITFFHSCGTNQLVRLEKTCFQKGKNANYPCALRAPLCTNETDMRIVTTPNEKTLELISHGKYKNVDTALLHCKKHDEPTALTLEYIAVQLPRSHSLR